MNMMKPIAGNAAMSATELTKIKQAANTEANRITRKEPLPNMEAEALSKIVKKAGAIGIPLIVTKSDIDTNSGHLVVEMDIPLGTTTVHKTLKAELALEVYDLFNKTKGWQKATGVSLKFKSAVSYDFLKAKTLPSELMQSLLSKVPSAPKGKLTTITLSAVSHVLKTTTKGQSRNLKLYRIADIIRPSSKKLADEIVSIGSLATQTLQARALIYIKLGLQYKLNAAEILSYASQPASLIARLILSGASSIARSLLIEFVEGTGPDEYYFGIDSPETQELLEHSYHKDLSDTLFNRVLEKFNGKVPLNTEVFNELDGGAIPDFGFDSFKGAAAAAYGLFLYSKMGDLVGSFTDPVTFQVVSGDVLCTGKNIMGLKSLFAGNLLNDQGLKGAENVSAGPMAAKTHIFQWKVPIPEKYLLREE